MTTKNMEKRLAVTADACTDRKCPFHGSLRLHGRSFAGRVLSSKPTRTATVMWERRHKLPKFERYERRASVVHAHNPPCLNAREGDLVEIHETRPLSKTKHFVVIAKRAGTTAEAKIKKKKQKLQAPAAAEDIT